ncbi:MAG: N-acetyltransferase [Dehalococcoidia bacterium]|nr:MAG: N-acetyltransferase [Dehalococcoidia bacterium]
MKVEKARIGDIPQIQRLVNYFADKGEMLPRALSELYENIRDLFVVRDGDEVVACAALHVFWSDLAEIRAVAVAEEIQDKGAGALLVQACLEEARSLGIDTIFCLTYKPDFFARLGFRQVDKMELPRKIWGECLKCPKFPDCDEVALVYRLER